MAGPEGEFALWAGSARKKQNRELKTRDSQEEPRELMNASSPWLFLQVCPEQTSNRHPGMEIHFHGLNLTPIVIQCFSHPTAQNT